LHLQLDLVDLQFVHEPLHIVPCLPRGGFRPILCQPRFRPPAQLGRVRCRGFVFFHGVAFLSRFFAPARARRSCASKFLAAVMFEKVITTPSIRFSRAL
jgi:hypothetical protein